MELQGWECDFDAIQYLGCNVCACLGNSSWAKSIVWAVLCVTAPRASTNHPASPLLYLCDIYFFLFDVWATRGFVLGSLLAVFGVTYRVLELEPELGTCEASVLPVVLSLWSIPVPYY